VTAIYIRCEDCPAVFDRRPKGDHRHGGAYKSGQQEHIYRDARAAGWRIEPSNPPAFVNDRHFCPKHAGAA